MRRPDRVVPEVRFEESCSKLRNLEINPDFLAALDQLARGCSIGIVTLMDDLQHLAFFQTQAHVTGRRANGVTM